MPNQSPASLIPPVVQPHKVAQPSIAPSAPIVINWSYPLAMPSSNIVFKVYVSQNLKQWNLLLTASAPPVSVGGSKQNYFSVVAYDQATGLYGE